MFETISHTINLIIWSVSVFSGIGLIYSYLDFTKREQRLPIATMYENLETCFELKKKEYDTIFQEVEVLHEKRLERDSYVNEVNLIKTNIESSKNELIKLKAEREEQEILRAEIFRLNQEAMQLKGLISKNQEELESSFRTKEFNENQIQKFEDKLIELDIEISSKQETSKEKAKQIEIQQTLLFQLQNDTSLLDEKIINSRRDFELLQTKIEEQNEIIQENTRLAAQTEDLREIIKNLNEDRIKLNDSLEEGYLEIKSSQEALKDIKNSLKKIEEEKAEAKYELQIIRQEKESLESERNILKQECDRYSPLIKEYKDKSENKNSLEDLEKPYFAIKVDTRKKEIKEEKALSDLKTELEKRKLHYPQRLLYSFHTSLKINDVSPLVVLSGISGTGKSQLPMAYASAMGINFLNIAVQPRWDSPQDIFGFYNYLEGRYKGTDLTRALIQAEKHNRKDWTSLKFPNDYPELQDQMTLFLFDEMNLARVEYYFSEFLSKMEARRGINPQDANERLKAEITLDTGRLQQGKDMRLFVDKNVLLVGTMNEDESTHSLSDKILDRANVLRFGKPKKLISNKSNQVSSPNEHRLSHQNWDSWVRNVDELQNSICETLQEKINKINAAMEQIGRPFGHRVGQSILSYVSNYPGISSKPENISLLAFADQIEQRILPKLRNVDCRANKEHLDAIESQIPCCDFELLSSFQEASKKDYFEWNGVARE
ncbi:McrB family protein [Criblamydia sequanensis]|uniref:Membrane protein n=1 Tax=Candidatus Criblamydia sequanensis CRIB-18 TaxID=1437425 RepID=A0A090DXR1_9BACT|nr:AAA family ATPase [Criblamydia sequanensis]CDR33584.1 putative membrane protein [Criblamydia sequanensis CRIB-18]